MRGSFYRLYHALSTMEYQLNSKHSGCLAYKDVMLTNVVMFTDGCTIEKLSRILGKSYEDVEKHVDRLMERGVLTRYEAGDGEASIQVSPKVYTIYAAEDRRINAMVRGMCERHSSEEMATFMSMLDEMSEGLAAYDPASETDRYRRVL